MYIIQECLEGISSCIRKEYSMTDIIMIQDNTPICPKCHGALRQIRDKDIQLVCLNKECGTVLRVIDVGQSCRELKCEVIK